MNISHRRAIGLSAVILALFLATGCRHQKPSQPGARLPRVGDEIIVNGKLYHTGTPVVTWLDQGGYDAYRVEMPRIEGEGRRGGGGGIRKTWSMRSGPLTDGEYERVTKDGWTDELLREKVDQFVLHYDVCGLSRTCFRVLADRGLGVQFMLDIDGTIYQTMDLKDSTGHATKANSRSIGIEIANMGAYSGSHAALLQWYGKDENGKTRITIPQRLGDGGVRTKDFVGRPARDELVVGMVQGANHKQYDFTPQQYDALVKLTATLCTVFPKIQPDYPRLKSSLGQPTTRRTTQPAGNPTTRAAAIASLEEPGELIPHTLTDEQYDNYQGVLGHYHVQTEKQDPGPAMQWEWLLREARKHMTRQALAENKRVRGQPAKFIPSDVKRPASRPSTSQSATTRSTTTQAATTQSQ
jgi:N-acetylmuramoyl-L-alanine amidase